MNEKEKISRKEFLKQVALPTLAAGADFLLPPLVQPARAEPRERLPAIRLDFDSGINGVPGGELEVGEIREPLNRAYFDPPEKQRGRSLRSCDPFYQNGEALKAFHSGGGKVNLVLEFGDGITIDPPEHLLKMVDWGGRFLGLGEGDKITLGNEHSPLKSCEGYPIKTYVGQFLKLQSFIKDNYPKVEVGLPSEAWYGNGEYFERLLIELNRRKAKFDFISFNYYGPIDQLAERVALYDRLLTKYGYRVPIEISEIGVFVSDNPAKARSAYEDQIEDQIIVDQDGQADYLLKALSLSLCCGVRRALWFNYKDDPDNLPLPTYGLVSVDGEVRKGLAALAFTRRLLTGVVSSKVDKEPLYTRLEFKKKDGSVCWVIWNTSSTNDLYLPADNLVACNPLGEQIGPPVIINYLDIGPMIILPKGMEGKGGEARVLFPTTSVIK